MNKYYKSVKKGMIISIISLIGLLTSMMVIPFFVQKILDEIINNQNYVFNEYINYIIILIIINIVCNGIFQYYSKVVGLKYDFDLRRVFFVNFLSKDYKSTSNIDNGSVINTLFTETQLIMKPYTDGKICLFLSLYQLFLGFLLITYYSVYVSIITVIMIFLIIIITKKVSEKIANITSDIQKISELENKEILGVVEANKTIDQLGTYDYFINRYDKILLDKVKKIKLLSKYQAIYEVVYYFPFIYEFFILSVGLYLTSKGEFTVGKIIAVQTAIMGIYQPIELVGAYLNDKKISKTMYEKNIDYFNENKNLLEDASIEAFENLKFISDSYEIDDNKEILKNILFDISKGGIYTIEGESGVGKSTIFNIISKFNDIKNTKVFINNKKIDTINENDLYKLVLQAEQHPVTINGTLEKNIVLDDKFTREEIDEVINVCMLDEFIEKHGKDFVIDENISGGEKQRIGLARILIRKRKLNLLDEPTSALNDDLSLNIVNNISNFIKKYDMTLVVITHKKDFTNIAKERIYIK